MEAIDNASRNPRMTRQAGASAGRSKSFCEFGANQAAQDVFRARDRGDTTPAGQLQLGHERHLEAVPASAALDSSASVIEFPYAFPRIGSYRLFVQVRRHGRVLTGAFAITVAEPTSASR